MTLTVHLGVQITKEGITGVFNSVLSDCGDRMPCGDNVLTAVQANRLEGQQLPSADWTCIASSRMVSF